MRFLLHSTLLASLLASLLPASAQAPAYVVVPADVPFKFTVGKHTFRSGHYEFIVVGTGIMAVRDRHHRVIASLITRTSEVAESSSTTKLVFDRDKKHHRLTKIFLEHRSQALEVVREQLAMRTAPPPPSLPVGSLSFSDRNTGFRLKQ